MVILAGQHSLLLGPPGTSKSELARELTGRIDGARYWEIVLSKFTDPKRMFGPVDVAALTRCQYVHRLAFVRSDSGPTRPDCAAMSIRSASTAAARGPGRRRLGAGRSLSIADSSPAAYNSHGGLGRASSRAPSRLLTRQTEGIAWSVRGCRSRCAARS